MVAISHTDILQQIDLARVRLAPDDATRVALGQVLTPTPIAQLMAGLLQVPYSAVSLLDPGAGIGVLSAAAVTALCARADPPKAISITACEIDERLLPQLHTTLALCHDHCVSSGIAFASTVIAGDFLAFAATHLEPMFARATPPYNIAILNPPYRKIQAASPERRLLSQFGVEVSNLYAGFVAMALKLLTPGGELVAITPRSFCNGPYFRPFRKLLLERAALRSFYVFDTRQETFRDDSVLQETIITAAVAGAPQPSTVTVVTAQRPDDEMPTVQSLGFEQVVNPHDPERFFHLIANRAGEEIAAQIQSLPATLDDLHLAVSTGRVVDFRVSSHLRSDPGPQTVALLYPTHCERGRVVWPKPGKKPNALVCDDTTRSLLVPNEPYVLVKRFSSKEERRRVVATLFTPQEMFGEAVAFENHLNYFHTHGRGLDSTLARGLGAFLNSTLVDAFFRQFNGHTQVNATDLRTLRYPSREQLIALGEAITPDADQSIIDAVLSRKVFGMSDLVDPTQMQRRIQEALDILKLLGLPRAQQNERSALTLLALLNLAPNTPWLQAEAPLCGITPMMKFFELHYGRTYAPNTRETVRRQTVHQFLEAGFIVANPDEPSRPVNSPKAVYQIEHGLLAVLQTYGLPEWDRALQVYLSNLQTLSARYARERAEQKITVRMAEEEVLYLSPGGQNELIKHVLEVFRRYFAADADLLYVGDAGSKFAFFKSDDLAALNVHVDMHGKMPDVIFFDRTRRWLFLIEAVTSHGPIDGKRHDELRRLFTNATAGLIYVTAFLDRKALQKSLAFISWETEVWVAESPSRLIHFDGDRFLGPYEGERGNS